MAAAVVIPSHVVTAVWAEVFTPARAHSDPASNTATFFMTASSFGAEAFGALSLDYGRLGRPEERDVSGAATGFTSDTGRKLFFRPLLPAVVLPNDRSAPPARHRQGRV